MKKKSQTSGDTHTRLFFFILSRWTDPWVPWVTVKILEIETDKQHLSDKQHLFVMFPKKFWSFSEFWSGRFIFFSFSRFTTSTLNYDHFIMQIAFPSKIICLTGSCCGSRKTDNLTFSITSARCNVAKEQLVILNPADNIFQSTNSKELNKSFNKPKGHTFWFWLSDRLSG